MPLTAPGCVDLIVTDVAVIEVTVKRLLLNEVAPGWSPEDMQALTLPTLLVNPDCEEIELLIALKGPSFLYGCGCVNMFSIAATIWRAQL